MELIRHERRTLICGQCLRYAEFVYNMLKNKMDYIFMSHILQWYNLCPFREVIHSNQHESKALRGSRMYLDNEI
jgi:hypothetical protein